LSDPSELLELIDKRAESNEISLDHLIVQRLSREPLLACVTAASAVFLREVISAVLNDNKQAALDEIFRLSEDEIPEEHAESYLLLAQNLCAACEYADGWVMFKKNYILYLLDKERVDEALVVISDLEEVLPDDDELKLLLEQAGVSEPINVAVVGLNQYSEELQRRIVRAPEKYRYKLVCFCDEKEEYVGQYLNGTMILDIKQLAKLYRRGEVDKVIVAFSGFSTSKTSNTFRRLERAGITDRVFTVPPWYLDGAYDYVQYSIQQFEPEKELSLDSALIRADMSRAVLGFIMPLSNMHCNYSCKSCVTASPLAEPGFMSLASYRRDIERLKELYWHICRFRISGGETLLHPDIAEMVKITRDAFPSTGLALQTNGLLLLKNDGRFDGLFNVMRENRCGFQISTYKPVFYGAMSLTRF